MFLLSSMSLRISASLTRMSSLTFATADAVVIHYCRFLFRSCCCWNETRSNLPLHPDVGVVHQDARQRCGQDALHLSVLLSDMLLPHLFFLRSGAGVGSAVAPLPARRSRRCRYCRRKCRVWTSNRPDAYVHSELKHSIGFVSVLLLVMLLLSINFLCLCFIKCAIRFCCCCVFSFSLCFCVLPCFMCFSFFCGGGIFYGFDDSLVSFRARALQY